MKLLKQQQQKKAYNYLWRSHLSISRNTYSRKIKTSLWKWLVKKSH